MALLKITLSSPSGKFKCSAPEWFSCPEGITPNSGLTGPNNTYIYIYIYTFCKHILLITFLNEPELFFTPAETV